MASPVSSRTAARISSPSLHSRPCEKLETLAAMACPKLALKYHPYAGILAYLADSIRDIHCKYPCFR